MDRIAIVTDSAASIPEEMVREAGLEIVPMGVQINHKIYREGIDITKEEFYAQLDTAERITTSQPSPGDFLEVYERVAARAKEIISIHITGEGSGTVNTANLVKQYISIPINVIDSRTASMGQGFIALAAGKAAKAGRSREEILRVIDNMRDKTAVFVAVPTLKYLAKSGKISSIKSLIANILSIKPILGVKDGVVEVVDKARSYPKALQRLISLMEERFPTEPLNIAILHTNAPEKAEEFRAKVEERLRHAKVFIAEMGTALAVHGGQGMLGIAAYPGQESE